MDTTIRVDKIHFVRSKKLKGGEKATRSIRTIHKPNNSIRHENGKILVEVIIDHKFASGKLTGEFSQITGNVTFTSSDVVLRGYLKGRKFELVGYNLFATKTNLSKRKTPAVQIKGRDFDYTRKNTGPRARW